MQCRAECAITQIKTCEDSSQQKRDEFAPEEDLHRPVAVSRAKTSYVEVGHHALMMTAWLELYIKFILSYRLLSRSDSVCAQALC